MTRIKTILFFLLTVTSLMSEGQVFPVQSTVQLTPPYSLYLSDYAAPGSERLRVTAFLIDATRPELNVRFRLRIEGNGIKIETKPEFMPPPVTLLGGVPLQLISSDLAAYFDPRNLNFTGITQREIEQRGALPEGLYQFCFEVIEYNRGVKISNTGCAVAWLILNDPPIVNVPADNEKIRIQDPQQVIFQWTPRHRGTPNSAFNAEYDFKLVEVWPSTRNPNDAILTSPVIFQTTTSETTIIYGPAETPLEPGRRYAFQLRAHAYAGADELSLFKNNGYSQVYTFVYGDACLPPKNILVSDVGTTRFNVSWDGASNQTTYALRYRLSPVASAKGDMSTSAKETPLSSAKATESAWYTNQSLTPNVTVNSLQPNTRYEFQVNAGCGTFTSDYSLVTNVTTKDNPGIQYSCGVPLTPFNLDPSQLINSLKVGDVIKAGDFDVVLSKVSGSNGTFSGEGVIEVSYFNQAKVKAEFTNINVNNEMRMVNGYMNVTGAGVEVIPAGVMNLMDNLDEALAQADKALDEYEANLPQQFDENAAVTSTLITVPGTATVTPGSNGSVVIVDGSGRRTEVPAGTTASVVDSSGKGYIIDSKGKVHTTTAAIATAAAKREYNLKLKFAEAQDQKFGFDAKRYDPIASTYTKVEDQFLSWKSVATGQLDKVLATLEGTGIDKSKIRFELNGSVVNSQWSLVNGGSTSITNDQSTISILGAGDGVESELIALYDAQAPVTNDNSPVTKTQVLGKLSVITYDQIVKDLVIVPVNGNKYPYSEDALRTQLNKIYGQAVVKWNITFASNLDVPGIDPFDDGGSGLLSNYSPDMRKVVNAYKANLQPNTYYLFLVKNPKSSTLAGFMPRSKECGFIFVDKNGSEESIVRTMAHELGHGAFSLRHTFSEEKNTLPEKGTDNLMDYNNGNKLFKYQWDRMRYPEIVMGLFEDDEGGAMRKDAGYLAFEKKLLASVGEEYDGFFSCISKAYERYEEVNDRYGSEGIAFFAGTVNFFLCSTKKENCSADNQFNCGFTNALLQEIDWITLADAVVDFEITKEDLKRILECLKDEVPIGKAPGDPTFEEAVFKCITGVSLSGVKKAIDPFVKENWVDEYYQGQATAFALTLIGPFKAGMLKKLKELPKFSGQFAKLSTLSKATKVDELISASRKLTDGSGIAVRNLINNLKSKLGFTPKSPLNFTGYKANTVDGFVDVVIHNKNGNFVITAEGAMDVQVSVDELASIINQTPDNKTVRLLSCNDLDAAKELSAKTAKPFYASDGWVDLYKDGSVRSDKDFYKFENGKQILDDKIAKNTSEISGKEKVRLGEGAKGGVDFADYVKTLKTKVNPRRDYPDGVFERHVTRDDIQYEAIGGGEKIWADGIDAEKKALLDAKHNPGEFYTIESYNQKPFLYGDLEDEFRRYSIIISDKSNPVEELVIFISQDNKSSVKLFEHLGSKYKVPVKVELVLWNP
ncbi:MAG: fibronectin type III domain-containing protein [Cyclobacteriaceae bacterium]